METGFVPAEPGWFVLEYHGGRNHGYFYHKDVVAWRVEEYRAYPVAVEPISSDYTLLSPKGRVICSGGRAYTSAEAWRKDEENLADLAKRRHTVKNED